MSFCASLRFLNMLPFLHDCCESFSLLNVKEIRNKKPFHRIRTAVRTPTRIPGDAGEERLGHHGYVTLDPELCVRPFRNVCLFLPRLSLINIVALNYC